MGWTLSLGDCLAGMAAMPDRSVDVILTDPPYSEKVHTGSRIGARLTDGFSRDKDFGFAHITQEQRCAVAVQFARVAHRWCLAFCDAESIGGWIDANTAAGLEHVRVGAWIKAGCTPQFSGDRPATGFEAVVIAHRPGKKRWNGGGSRAVWDIEIVRDTDDRGEQRVHTTQKPLALMEALVRDFTDPGETVLDPFAGSGTTGVACIRQGRNFIGFEKDAKYHALATKRLEGTREQASMFEKRGPKPKQATMFGGTK